jgi:uncharacterized HAD superfamily protein
MAAVGVDIDDVLYPWFDTAHRLSEAAGITNGAQPTSWAPYEDYGCTAEQWYEVLAAGAVDGSLYHEEPLPDAVSSLQALKDAGHSVHLVTARGLLANGHLIRTHTIAWLENHGVPLDTLTFSKDKSIVRCDYFIDDNADNIASVCSVKGTMGFLVDRPYNQHAATGKFSWRVPTVAHAVGIINYPQRHLVGLDE